MGKPDGDDSRALGRGALIAGFGGSSKDEERTTKGIGKRCGSNTQQAREPSAKVREGTP